MRSTSSVCYYSERESPSRRRQRRPILLSHWLPFPTEDQERSIQSNWQQSGSSSLQQSNEFILFNRIPQDLSTRLSMPSRAHLSLILSQRQAHRTFDPRQSEYRARVNRARLSFYRPVPGAVVAANSSSSLTRRGGQPEPARSRGDALIDSSAIMAVNTIIVPHGQEEVRQSSREQGTVDPTLHPQFSVKDVYTLSCIHCRSSFTLRGMRATLLGDTSTQLFSTDLAPAHIQMIDKEYTTPNCA